MPATRMVKARGPKASIQSFDALVPIGTPCEVNGIKTKTWSHAGYGKRGVPVVFVEDIEEPVPLSSLRIEGVEWVSQREVAKRERGRRSKS